MPVRPGIRRSSRAASYEPFSRALSAAAPSGQTVTSWPEPGQLHLHQVAEVRLVVGEQDAQAALVGFLHENRRLLRETCPRRPRPSVRMSGDV